MPSVPIAAQLFLISTALAFGCECAYAPACSRIHDSAAIFVGKVLDDGPNGNGPFRFQVEEKLKGLKGEREVQISGGLCTSGYQRGERYLVLANRWPDNTLYSGDCSGTISAKRAEGDIRIMRAWARGTPSPQLQGRLAENTEDSMVRYQLEVNHRPGLGGVKLVAAKDGRNYQGVSDASGYFRLPVSGPGTYRLVATYPGLLSSQSEYEFEVKPGSCAEHDIGMWTASKVTGQVLDPARQPVPGIPVEAVEASQGRTMFPLTAVTDAAGMFEFTRVPKGEYLLGVNIHGLNSKLPYEPRFYPSVARRELAVPIHVGGPGILSGMDLQIGDRLPTRAIRVSVVWPDGSPVTNTSVRCDSIVSDDRRFTKDRVSRYTDSRGEAVCEVLSDRDFQVEVDRLFWSASSRPVQPIATRAKVMVRAGREPASLRIQLDRLNDIRDKETPSDMSRFNDRD